MAKISRQKFSGMGYYEEDFQKDRKWSYDLTINSTLNFADFSPTILEKAVSMRWR